MMSNCKYCNGEFFKVFENMSIKLDDGIMSIITRDKFSKSSFVGSLFVKFCPFCGRKLEKEVFDYWSSD